jgi:hypothetical protein
MKWKHDLIEYILYALIFFIVGFMSAVWYMRYLQ